MSVGEKVKALLSQFGSEYQGTPLTFAQLDTDIVQAKLKLKEEGASRGKRSLPPVDTESFDDIEQKIVACIYDEVQAAKESYHDHLRSFEDRMVRMNVVGHAGKLESIAIAAESDFKAHVHKRKDQLYTLRANITELSSDLEKFKKKNELERTARYPENRFWFVAIIIFLVSVETIANGIFFAEGDEKGLAGGVFTALVPSLFNAVFGWVYGNLAMRLAIHRFWLKKALGILLCILVPILVIAWNLLVAHYRTAVMALVGDGAAQQAVETFRAMPFGITDIKSWSLFMAGFVSFSIIAGDAWKMDDAYFRYGSFARELKSKIDEYALNKSDALEELEEVRNDNLEALEEVHNLVNARMMEASSVFDSYKRWADLFNEHMKHLETAGRVLLGIYRSANMAERMELDRPKFFQSEWKMERPELPKPGIDFMRMLDSFQSESVSMQSVYVECGRRIGVAFNNALDAYHTIDQLTPEELQKWRTGIVAANGEEKLPAAA